MQKLLFGLLCVTVVGCQANGPSDKKVELDVADLLAAGTNGLVDVSTRVVKREEITEDRVLYVVDVTLTRNKSELPAQKTAFAVVAAAQGDRRARSLVTLIRMKPGEANKESLEVLYRKKAEDWRIEKADTHKP